MSLKDTLQADLKTSMLARDSFRTDVIKSLKSAILYAEVATGKREEGLRDEEILSVLKKESKKRLEAAELFARGGNAEKADAERREKELIDAYLPAQLGEEAVSSLITAVLTDLGIAEPTKQDMGRIMGAVKAKGGAEVDGSMLARLVNARING